MLLVVNNMWWNNGIINSSSNFKKKVSCLFTDMLEIMLLGNESVIKATKNEVYY